jgi:hypothetical protein
MHQINAQTIMDYTTVPAGLLIRGQLWTGQATASTALCQKCGRIGVASTLRDGAQIVVHRGRVNGGMLEGIDYCEAVVSMSPAPR